MKALGGNKVLGLAVGEKSILVCELARAGSRTQATRLAEFEFPPGASFDDPEQLGKALGAFLRERKISARRAVIGLPLRWAVVKPKEVPPADAKTVSGLLLLQAEREFALEPQDLVFEYAGASDPSATRTVLMLAVQRRRVESAAAAAEAAGLSVRAVTLSAVALATETGRQLAHGGAVLHVAPGAAELAIHHDGQPRVLRHLRTPAAAGASTGAGAPPAAATGIATGIAPVVPAEPLAGEPPRFADGAAALTPELRQVLSLMPQNGTAAPTELVVWDGIGLGDLGERWGDQLGVTVRELSLDSLGVTLADGEGAGGAGAADRDAGGRFATAVALGLEALRSEAPATDLLHSRLVPRKEARVGRWTVWGIVIGAAAVIAIAVSLFDLARQRSEVAEGKAALVKMKPDLEDARGAIERTTHAQKWTSTDTKALELLQDLTLAFPDGGRVWATSLSLQPDGRVTLTCRAVNDEARLDFLKRLREGGQFTDVQAGGTQPAGRGSSELSFTINLRAPGIS